MLTVACLSVLLAAFPASEPCSRPTEGLERGTTLEMQRDDIRRAGPALFDQVSVVGFSKDGKVAWIERPAVTRSCVKDDGGRRLVVEDPRTRTRSAAGPPRRSPSWLPRSNLAFRSSSA